MPQIAEPTRQDEGMDRLDTVQPATLLEPSHWVQKGEVSKPQRMHRNT